MAITSRNDSPRLGRYGRTQFRYATVYVCVTFLVLLLLNLYTTQTSQELFCQGKESAMVERCNLAAGEFAELEVFSPATVSAAVSQMGTLRLSRMMVTDIAGVVIYDSADSALGKTGLLPEIVAALGSNDVFSWQYYEGAMHSRAAVPIYSYGTMIGAVYMAEYDSSQGALMQSLQSNILSITLALEVVLILFSMFYAGMFSRRLRRIMDSMAEIRKGDYSQKVKMGGNDELTILGNEFNRLSERLQTSEKKRQQFVSDASHELKTPLASIKLLSDSILQNEMDMDTVREFVGDIGSEADRLNRMSQKLLSLSRIEGEEDEDCEILDICPTVERVARMLEVIAGENGITIELELREPCPVLILEDDLYQIAYNLVENGIKYNTPGGVLTVGVYRDGENAILEVADTGVGIPAEAIGHLFERFYRVDKARARKSGGSGLGLSIVYNLVQRHRGEITVESALGQGSIFRVTLPIFDTEEDG